MFAEPMIGGQGGMGEGPLTGHADADHHFFGGMVMNGSKGIYVFQTPAMEAGQQTGFCSFRRETLAPKLGGQPPSYFNTGGKIGLETGMGKSDEADKGACFFPLRCE